MSISDAQFKDMHSRLGSDGGFSVDPKTGDSPTDGGMIAMPNSPEMQVRSSETSPGHIKDFVARSAQPLSQKGAHVGGWRNPDDGKDYFDVSRRVAPKESVARDYGKDVADADALTSASDLGIAQGEKAVYSPRTGRDVSSWGSETPPARRGK